MFNMDLPEFLLLLALALIILGPEKFPQYTKIALKAYRDIRSYFEEAKRDIAQELNPVKHEFSQLTRFDPETYINKLTDSMISGDEPKQTQGSISTEDPYTGVQQPVGHHEEDSAVPAGADTAAGPAPDALEEKESPTDSGNPRPGSTSAKEGPA